MLKNNNTSNKPLLITTGEPAGIGMDIVLDLAGQGYFASLGCPVLVTACEVAMRERLALIQSNHREFVQTPTWETIYLEGVADVADVSSLSALATLPALPALPATDADFYLLNIATDQAVQAGEINVANASMVIQQLALAHHFAVANTVAAIITAPLQKSALIEANLTLPDGTMFSGHTEYFMQMSGCQKVVMMLANTNLKVALVTTHLPLKKVAEAITKTEVKQTVQIVLDSLHQQFGITQPKVLVCGLNPHAGEGGHLGMEEIEVINPVLQSFIDGGHDVSLAMPADTLFTKRYLAECDATIAMYHDQGLPVLKSHGFGDSVNITLGLPYVRTSVDHGTALDLAGTGKASSDSLKQAITYAMKMS